MSQEDHIEAAITAATGETARFAQSRMTAGGSINVSRVVELEDGRRFFVKTHPDAGACPGMFAAEFEALGLLAVPGVIRVPVPVVYGDDFIVMEAYAEGPRKPAWQELMGRGLAQLHQAIQTDRFGLDRDNYLGTTPQPNGWMDSWVEFWRERRLGWQLQLFSGNTDSSDHLLQLGLRLQDRLHEWLGSVDEPAVLLHGDLWSGNAAADEKGGPIIFDPASYYGHREAEIGMMRMFGGFGPRCEAAYAEVWPLQPGAEERIALYRLYHELNHLNLFGRSYYQSCISTMEQLLR